MTANQSFEPSPQSGAAQFHRQAARCMSEVDTLYPRILERFRSRIRERRYVVTLDALDEIDEDPLSVFDVERAILNGKIIQRQRDQTTREWKYLVRGYAVDGR